MALVIIHRIVLCKQVVPCGERAGAPAKTAAEFRPRGMPLDLIQDGVALCFRQTIEARDIERVEERGGPSAQGMPDDRRMSPLGIGLRIASRHLDGGAGALLCGRRPFHPVWLPDMDGVPPRACLSLSAKSSEMGWRKSIRVISAPMVPVNRCSSMVIPFGGRFKVTPSDMRRSVQ
jgi:hypothetical protein